VSLHLLSLWILLWGATVPSPAAEVVTREAWAMGTRVRVSAEAAERGAAEGASEAALAEIERMERLLSTWDDASELSRLNRAPRGEGVRLGAELASLLEEAERWATRTGRAFDPTVGALVQVWGVREGRASPPTLAEVAFARAATGPGALEIGDGTAMRRVEGAWIDSGGFGKGAALREIARTVPATGVDRLLVDLGGQLWAAAPGEAPWRVTVAHPSARDRAIAGLAVHGVSVATSGSSERPGHLLDPRTGMPAPEWGSVTVIHADALAADVLSTALYVMGPAEGLAWARAEGIAALFAREEGKGLGLAWTEEMQEWLIDIVHP